MTLAQALRKKAETNHNMVITSTLNIIADTIEEQESAATQVAIADDKLKQAEADLKAASGSY